MKEKSILQEFISAKLKAHRKPKKKGVPRGEPIGPSHKKFHASLLMLTRGSQKSIAEKVRSSHSLILKWRTEEQFRQLCAQHMAEFIKIFLPRVNQSRKSIIRNGFKGVWIYKDVSIYSAELILNIWDCINTAMREDPALTIEEVLPHFFIFKDVFLSELPDTFGPATRTIIFMFRWFFLNELREKLRQATFPDKALFDHFLKALIVEHLLKMGKAAQEEIPHGDDNIYQRFDHEIKAFNLDGSESFLRVHGEATWEMDLWMRTREILDKDRALIRKWLKR